VIIWHNSFTGRTGTASTLLLTKHFGESLGHAANWFTIFTLTAPLFVKNQIEPTLSEATHIRHRIFLLLQ
jgi:hypothetical protein